MSRKRHNPMDRDPSELPHLEDVVFCSGWEGAREFVEESRLPEERYEWSRARNWETGEWWIQGQARPAFSDKCLGRWLWFGMKVRLLWRKARSYRWWPWT